MNGRIETGPVRRVTACGVVTIAVASLVGCCGSKPATETHTTESSPSILAGPVRPATFTEVERSVRALYRAHPAIGGFIVQDVEYTPATRAKVLSVCHRGGPEKSAVALESARVLACAPLIFFFYMYGRMHSVPASLSVARQLYSYAVVSNRNPRDAEPGLKALLRRWGVR
jgi:hypothetical protein